MNLSLSFLYVRAIKDFGSRISSVGALVAYSGTKTGRSPKDKRFVYNDRSKHIWWGDVNIAISQELHNCYLDHAKMYIKNQKNYYILDAYAGWDPSHRMKIRIYCHHPYHALFMQNMLIPSTTPFTEDEKIDFTIYNVGHLELPETNYDNTLKNTLISLDLENRNMIIYGTEYAGEMKKGILTLMMYEMPLKGFLPLHSSCNINPNNGNSSLFLALSGCGKTSLSADPDRTLIGDDEHVWTDTGIFNVEGGCYAKCINLSQKNEPEIFAAIRFGSVLENIVLKNDGTANYDDTSITKNTRCSYPLNYIEKVQIPAICGHPNNIILLTCDAFGLLPPVAKLNTDQAVFQFICGYTSKIPGTEMGISEPIPVFSSCFGEPFIVWSPILYGELLRKKLEKHNANVWLVNTGWIGGPYGVGKRISIKYSRTIINAIHNNTLTKYVKFPHFGFNIPIKCEGIPADILDPRNLWEDKNEYDSKLIELYHKFKINYKLKIK